MKTKYIILIVLIYIFSCFGCYKTVQWSYKNKWTHSNPNAGHVIMCFIPVYNTIICIIWPICHLLDGDDSPNDFFNIPKRK